MNRMATWEDGPEYAPLQRPADFAVPAVAPLDPAPPYEQPAAQAPKDRPTFGDPPVPVAPLGTLIPVVADVRDPHRPFDVVSSSLTSDSAWGAARWSQPTAVAVLPPPALTSPVPPLTGPAPGPMAPPPSSLSPWAPPPPPPDPHAAHPGYPIPGTPGWFGPGAYGEQPATGPGKITARNVIDTATPGLLIVLGIGAVLYPLSPIMIAVGLGLASRVRVAQPRLRNAFLGCLGWMFILGVYGTLTGDGTFSSWWRFLGLWSLLMCWLLLILTPIAVYRKLRQGQQPRPRRATWG